MTESTTPARLHGDPAAHAAYGEAGPMVLDILTASMSANAKTMDTLYESERERRQALEVHIDHALAMFEAACGGTVREYEACVKFLRRIPSGSTEVTMAAAEHWENDAR